MQKKNSAKFILAFIAVFVLAMVIITYVNYDGIEHVAAVDKTNLAPEDFIVENSKGNLNVGVTSWEEATALFEGEILGRSTVYHPDCHECYLTFTKKENILCKMDILEEGFSTYRGINLSSSFSEVVNAYGKNYDKINLKNKPEVFDIIYGTDNHFIVFQFNHDLIKKIVIYNNHLS